MSVRGEAVLEVEPEIVHFNVAVVGRDRDRDHALESLHRRADQLSALLRGFGDAIERTATTSLRVQPQFKDGRPSEKVTGYAASLTLAVTVASIDRLGEIVAAVAREELATVAGPVWALRRDSDVYRAARVAAARDAVQRASQYAGAVGATVAGLLEFADAGLLGDTAPQRPMAPAAVRASAPAAASEPPAFDLEPVRQVVRASVDARFVITEPNLDVPALSGGS